jgi:hypothetical protein
MKSRRIAALVLAAGMVAVSSYTLRADVRADERTKIEFAGMLGRMFNLFGGKGARDGVVSTVAVKGDRKSRINDTTGQIIDLKEEKIYDLDVKKKTYKVTTFADLRQKMLESQQRAKETAAKEEPKPQPQEKAKADEPQVEVDFDIKNTGMKKSLNGFDTHEAVVTVTVREKGKTLEQGGGLVMTTDMWLTANIAAMKDVRDFDIRYAKAMYGPMMANMGDVSAEQMSAAMAMYPQMKQAMGKMSTEGGKIEGTPVLTVVTMDAVKSEDQLAQEAKQTQDAKQNEKTPTNVGSLVGRFAARAAAKKMGSEDAAKARATFMTSTVEVMKVVTSVSDVDVAIPAGYKEGR